MSLRLITSDSNAACTGPRIVSKVLSKGVSPAADFGSGFCKAMTLRL
jgi:hypothetical protein